MKRLWSKIVLVLIALVLIQSCVKKEEVKTETVLVDLSDLSLFEQMQRDQDYYETRIKWLEAELENYSDWDYKEFEIDGEYVRLSRKQIQEELLPALRQKL